MTTATTSFARHALQRRAIEINFSKTGNQTGPRPHRLILARVTFALGCILLAAAPPGSAAPDSRGPDTCAATAIRALAGFGISPANITDTHVSIIRTPMMSATADVIVWLKVKQCPAGRVVVQMNPDCLVSEVHTRGDCNIGGIPAY